tara:strand:- start:2648 stop:2869 length:222 start_codon:yes stop_codon:yes gene_type:complete
MASNKEICGSCFGDSGYTKTTSVTTIKNRVRAVSPFLDSTENVIYFCSSCWTDKKLDLIHTEANKKARAVVIG